MNYRVLNLLIFGAAVGCCFFQWMGFLGQCYLDGFLDLEVVEAAADRGVRFDFVFLCLCPSVMMGYVLHSIIIYGIKRRKKNGNKNED